MSMESGKSNEKEKSTDLEISIPKINFDDKFKDTLESNIKTSKKCLDFLNWDNEYKRTKTSYSNDNLTYDFKKDIDRSKYLSMDAFLNNSRSARLPLNNSFEKLKLSNDFIQTNQKEKENSFKSSTEMDLRVDSYNAFSNPNTSKVTFDLNRNSITEFEKDKKGYLKNLNQFEDINKYGSKINPIVDNLSYPNRITAVSAFDSDSDVLLLQKNGIEKTGISAITQKYLAFNNLSIPVEKKTESKELKFSPETKFENEFLNIFSLKIKKNANDSHNDSPHHSLRDTNGNYSSHTIESEHLDSDYAKGPIFPSEVYGSRPGVDFSTRQGIYTRKSNEKSKESDESKDLDSESLKLMDKKLKKLIKKNLKEDLKTHLASEELKSNSGAISWEIPVETKGEKQNDSISTSNQSYEASSFPYLPLRDVPVHELVKKLRHEFELQGDVSCIPNGLNDIYRKFQHQFQENKEETKTMSNLETLVKNPAKILIENYKKETKQIPAEASNNQIASTSKASKAIEQELQENLDKKKKIQELIKQQKKKHEKRIKTLEKLVKFEKLQAQKLKKIMLLNQNDSMCSLIYDSFVQRNNLFLDQSKLDEEYLEKLENERILIDENLKRLYEFCKSENSSVHSKTNTPREREEDKLESSENESLSGAENAENQESGIESSESSSEKVVTNLSEVKPIASWFLPIKPSKPSPIKVETIKPQVPKETFMEIVDEQQECIANPRKACLQEAFQMHKYDFLKRSKNRVKEIKLKAARRQVANELKVNDPPVIEAKYSRIKNFKSFEKEKEIEKPIVNKKYNYFTVDKGQFSKNRVMTSQEIKEQTKKKYQKLPEVKEKQLRQKLEETKIRNRIKSNIYKKAIQQKVLSSGPNFNLNYKALENQI